VATSVVFVHGVSQIGGAERELLLYLDRLPPLGYRPIVVCPASGPLADAVRARGVELEDGEFPPWRKLSSLLARRTAAERLRRTLDARTPDLIHVNDIWWVPQVLKSVGSHHCPIIAHVRQEIEATKVPRYELDRVDLVLAVSQQIERSIRAAGVPAERVRTLYSGLNVGSPSPSVDTPAIRRRYGIPERAFLLGTVANLFPRKGFEVMLRALARLPSSPESHYLIVGSGDAAYERELRALVDTLALQAQVHFAGFQLEVFPFLQTMDLYVQPSLLEGFGIAVIEAMAAGKAVVGTKTGGLPEVIVHGETGLLVPSNDEAALARAIQTLMDDVDTRERFGRAGVERARRCFGLETMMDGLREAYEAVSANRALHG